VLPAVGNRAKKHQRDGTTKPNSSVELRVVKHDDSDDDGATSQHTQTHQHSKSATGKVAAPISATCHTDPNALDTQRIDFQPDREFQVYPGTSYRLATTPQAKAVQQNLDKKGKNSVKGMEPPACDTGVNDLHIQNVK
jgi:hypothetical protein